MKKILLLCIICLSLIGCTNSSSELTELSLDEVSNITELTVLNIAEIIDLEEPTKEKLSTNYKFYQQESTVDLNSEMDGKTYGIDTKVYYCISVEDPTLNLLKVESISSNPKAYSWKQVSNAQISAQNTAYRISFPGQVLIYSSNEDENLNNYPEVVNFLLEQNLMMRQFMN